MKNFKLLLITLIVALNSSAQTNVVTKNKLIIDHGDIVLYLSDDTCTMVSKHNLTYDKFLKINGGRDDHWFQDTYKGKYVKGRFRGTGYDLGHLTPSHITSYDDSINHTSFSMFNEAPQLARFNEQPWKDLEMHVEDSVALYKVDAIIITGVIYDNKNVLYLPNSRIKIPSGYYKVLTMGKKSYYWIGDNVTGIITETDLKNLNALFKKNNMNLVIN